MIGLLLLASLYLWELRYEPGVNWSLATVGTVIYLALFASIIAFLLWNSGVSAIGPNTAGLYIHLYPLFTTVLAILFLGESLQLYHIAGATLIFGGLFLTTVAPGPAAEPE